MKLSFEKPYCFIDLETTGTSTTTDKIVSIAILKINKGFDFITYGIPNDNSEKFYSLVNPVLPLIPAAATAVHGITNDMVKDQPTFQEIANQILKLINDTVIVTYNGNSFDVPLLFNEFERAAKIWDYRQNTFIDACNIFKTKEPRTLEAAYKFYTLAEMTNAHNAMNDVYATFDVFINQMLKYEDLPGKPEELALYSNYNKPLLDIAGKFTTDDKGVVVFNFGQHKGKPAKSEKLYLEWIIGPKATFSRDTKLVAQRLLNNEL